MIFMNKKSFVRFSLVIIWLIVIFCFSAQNSDRSDGQSKGLIEGTVTGTINITDSIGITDIKPTEDDITSIVDKLNHPIRKCAHATVYFVLAILVLWALETNDKNLIKNIIITLIFCFLYACTDEFHQLFVSGRSGSFIDCLIDTAGATIACVVYAMFLPLSCKFRKVF